MNKAFKKDSLIPVVLYGAGSDLPKILPMLHGGGYKPVCIADGSREKIGKGIQGIPIVSPESIAQYDAKIIIITASFFDSIYKRIKELLGKKLDTYTVLVSPYAWLMLIDVEYDDNLYHNARSFIEENKEKIKELYDSTDRTTSDILSFFFNARTEKPYSFCEYSSMKGMQYIEGYFYKGELQDIGLFTFIDAGAFIGDTYEQMKTMYSSQMLCYYGYEPSEENFRLFSDKLDSLKGNTVICCRNAALGEAKETVSFGKSGGCFGAVGSNDSEGHESVQVVKLDDEDLSVSGKLVIKMDGEGSEMSILRGGPETIRKYHPIMAICVYHKYRDIYDLPKFIKDMGLNYRFVLRSGIHTHLIAFPQD